MTAYDRSANPAPVIQLDNVTFRRGDRTILDAISFAVRAGEHWSLIGPNGAGKSTILGFCGAVTHPTSGTVDILGRRLGHVELQTLRRSIGHVDPRHPIRSPLSLREVVLTGLTGTIETLLRWRPERAQVEHADKLIDQIGLSKRSDDVWPNLSQGERGRALVARALMSKPSLLLLDEPTTGLDVAAREQLLTTIADLEHTQPELASILVTHHLEELPSSTSHAVLLSDGRVVSAGPIHDVLTTANVSSAFEHPIRVGQHDRRWYALAESPPSLRALA
ncbi:ABC transporter ATP-binding protein [Aeromicrobium sp. 9AM]|uniref:ABC transporter ATP-binding protein n=1 Tax=Aeromicrobium sp. 9AM TaxID=2653126 RepID=UPI0012F4671F|nr:ATP-binding cassette domain-containing protein [Aeromicrobium sp. 9AM]VXB08112.1 Iron complex transport system ATP-binding protein [Aeromicrobium sp. 9AM]